MPSNNYLLCWICQQEIRIRPDVITFNSDTQGLSLCGDCASAPVEDAVKKVKNLDRRSKSKITSTCLCIICKEKTGGTAMCRTCKAELFKESFKRFNANRIKEVREYRKDTLKGENSSRIRLLTEKIECH